MSWKILSRPREEKWAQLRLVDMPSYDDLELAAHLRALPPAPAHWVEVAAAIPHVQRQLDEVLPRIEETEALRAAETDELERALREAGAEPDPLLVAAARRRLSAQER